MHSTGSRQLYEHRVAIETELAARQRELFALDETIILYEPEFHLLRGYRLARNEKAEHGYSRDHRPAGCKQVVIGLVLDGERRTKYSPATPKTRTAWHACSIAWTAAPVVPPGGRVSRR